MIADVAPRKADREDGGSGLPADGLPMPGRYLAIAAVSLGTALTTIDGQIANVALPTIARDLKVDGSAAVLVVTVYQLVLVMTLLPFSALGDRIGLKANWSSPWPPCSASSPRACPSCWWCGPSRRWARRRRCPSWRRWCG
jgi:hypothetical protein